MKRDETCLFDLVDKIRVTWEITRQCNYNCDHCCTDAVNESKEELPTKRVLEVIDEMDQLGVAAIYFSGGEPLKRKDILEILQYASSKENIKRINLATNGSLITNDTAKILANLNLESVLISLDGHTEEINNSIRGIKTAYNDALNGIELLSREGVNVRVGAVIWKENINFLEEITQLAIDKNAYQIFFNWLVKVGRCNDNPAILVNESHYLETSKRIMALKEKYADQIKVGYHRFKTIYPGFPNCEGGKKIYHITAKGEIGPCSWVIKGDKTMQSKNSLFDFSLAELMENSEIKRFKELVQQREEKWGIGCPAMCLSENNNYFSYDPLLDGVGKFVKK
jgi:MoaA/NifB/PqqE/SkfB family radical SAM enzyme